MKNILIGILCFILLIFGLNFLGLSIFKYFGPKIRQVENQIFKESEQYNDGMIRDLENLRLEYLSSDSAHKQLLKGTILHRFSVFPKEKLTTELRSFYEQLLRGEI